LKVESWNWTCFKSDSVVSLDNATNSISFWVNSQYFNASLLLNGPGVLQKKKKKNQNQNQNWELWSKRNLIQIYPIKKISCSSWSFCITHLRCLKTSFHEYDFFNFKIDLSKSKFGNNKKKKERKKKKVRIILEYLQE